MVRCVKIAAAVVGATVATAAAAVLTIGMATRRRPGTRVVQRFEIGPADFERERLPRLRAV